MTGPGVAVPAGVGGAATTFTPAGAPGDPQIGDMRLPAALGDPGVTGPPPGGGVAVAGLQLAAALGVPGATVVEEGVSVAVTLGPLIVIDPNASRAVQLGAGPRLTITPGRVKTPGRIPSWFPFIARALAALLIELGLAEIGRVGTETPVDLQNQLPFIRIVRVGGDSDLVNDYPQVDLDVFAASSVDGERLSEAIRQLLTMPAPPYVDGVLLDRIVCLSGAVERPWADVNIRRYGATYRVVARRQPAPFA